MSNNMKCLFRINKNKAECAVEVLAEAFKAYPLFQYYFTNESIREKISRYILSFAIYSGIRYGEVYATSPNMEGIAVWIPSSNYPMTFWKMLRSVPISKILGVGRYGGLKLKNFNEYIDNVHQRLVPFNHWFLQAIGVDPSFQGHGYASLLIRPMLSKIDKENLPCYLETVDEKNVSIYERFGFQIIDESIVPETEFTSWAMLRESPPVVSS